jgi:methylated-DNA-protein-cysteine methyltransferase-like protein
MRYERIYLVIEQIPSGKVATYGQIARIVGDCSARMVGYALAALKDDSTVPWQRVINSLGKISLRINGMEDGFQRQLLESEGVRFDNEGRVDLKEFGWAGPDWDWLAANGFF